MAKMAGEGRNLIVKAYRTVAEWSPAPLKKPIVDLQLDRMPPIARAAESIKYNVMAFEFWISPLGGLRECFRVSLSFSILLFLIWLPLTIAGAFAVGLFLQMEIIAAHIFRILIYALSATVISLLLYLLWQHRLEILTLLGRGGKRKVYSWNTTPRSAARFTGNVISSTKSVKFGVFLLARMQARQDGW